MKKLFPIFAIAVIALAVLAYNQKSKTHLKSNRILEANLFAALNLDRKYIATCGPVRFDYLETSTKAPLFQGMGDHTFSVSNANSESQTYFNQGLNLTYGFNHSEAHRSFREAATLSDKNAMAFWGQAYTLSPNLNNANIDQKRREKALEAITLAMDRINEVNDLESALIKALNSRFYKDKDGSIKMDNEAYTNEMAAVAGKYSDSPEVLTLYAAAIMNTMPWDYWERDMTPHKNTLKAKEALEKAISINPRHPGAHHYYIHLTELPFPELAAQSGDALAPLMPGAGHIVHMPSHAYVRVGRYFDAAVANMKAIRADESYITQCYSQGNYPLTYYPHNVHFLWYAATVMGDSKTAIAAAKKTSEKVSTGQLAEFEFMQEFASIPTQAYVRFGQWNEILTIPYPGDNVKHMKLFWHYARGLAFIRKGLLDEAKEELDALENISMDASYDQIYARNENHSGDVADVAYNVVAGEYFAARDDGEMAGKHFKAAIVSEDNLTYTEPPSWHLPVRHNYGAFLVDQKQYEEAEKIYKEDLSVFWNNGWSLIGLYSTYLGQGEESKAKEIKIKFEESWQYADIKITRSAY
jgi:tetratricopeptide (TPR) repeat protein